MSRRPLILVAVWLAAFAAALAADRPVAQAVKDRGWDRKAVWTRGTHRAVEAIKVPGEYTAVAVAAGLLAAFHPAGWRAAALVGISGLLSGLNGLLKWVVGRRRPVTGVRPFDLDLFVGGLPGLVGAEKNLCFPSGHAALAFAAATALAACLPRWRWAFYAVAVVVGVERVAENAHYVSDAVAGAAVGAASTWAAMWLCRRFVPGWRGVGPPIPRQSPSDEFNPYEAARAADPALSNPQSTV